MKVKKVQVINITEKNFSYVEEVKKALAKSDAEGDKFLFVCEGEETAGVVGFMNCIKQEPGGANVRLIFIQDGKAKKFLLTEGSYAEQLSKDLLMNVYKNGTVGSYRHLKLENSNNDATLKVEHAYINALTRGDLASLKWIEGQPSNHK